MNHSVYNLYIVYIPCIHRLYSLKETFPGSMNELLLLLYLIYFFARHKFGMSVGGEEIKRGVVVIICLGFFFFFLV